MMTGSFQIELGAILLSSHCIRSLTFDPSIAPDLDQKIWILHTQKLISHIIP